jgi:hypothetical protein
MKRSQFAVGLAVLTPIFAVLGVSLAGAVPQGASGTVAQQSQTFAPGTASHADTASADPAITAAGPAFNCTTGLVFASTTTATTPTVLNAQVQSDTGSSFAPYGVANPGWFYNALGFDTANDYLFATSYASPSNPTKFPGNHLLEIDSTGAIHDMGAISGLTAEPAGGVSMNAGAFDASGNYYIAASN